MLYSITDPMASVQVDQHGATQTFALIGQRLNTAIVILTLRDPPRLGPAHPPEHGNSAALKSLDPKQCLGFRVFGFMVFGVSG